MRRTVMSGATGATGDTAARDAAIAEWLDPATAMVTPLGDGYINDTWLVATGERRLVLQRINQRVFPEPQALMAKVAAVVDHLHSARRSAGNAGRGGIAVPALLPTRTGASCFDDPQGGVWRAWQYLGRTRTLQELGNPAQAQAAGRAFGALQLALLDMPGEVPDPIPGFMQLAHYLDRLDHAVARCDVASDAAVALQAVAARRDLATAFERQKRLIHGDCKVNNLLFHEQRDEVVCVIDLDTVMRGHWAWDFGDLVRSAAADLSGAATRARFDVERFGAAARGFVGSGAVARDIDALVLAPRYVALMLAVRFLTDHLEDDRYFKVKVPGENLLRARQQLDLVAAMEGQEREMRRAVRWA
jgi:Ser/Thr protein kinase RdoA (MazF antagonist)